MGYVPTVWDATKILTCARLNNFETQFDEFKTLYDVHNHDTRYYTKSEMETTFWYDENDGSGSGWDADQIYHSSGNKHAVDFAGGGVPEDLIVMYPEMPAPPGWHVCDGTGGTVDLRDKFIVGAGTGSGYNVGNTGGSVSITPTATLFIASHVLTISELPPHDHSWVDYYLDNRRPGYDGGGFATTITYSTDVTGATGGGGGHSHPGSTWLHGAVDNRPPYYALVFIQKV